LDELGNNIVNYAASEMKANIFALFSVGRNGCFEFFGSLTIVRNRSSSSCFMPSGKLNLRRPSGVFGCCIRRYLLQTYKDKESGMSRGGQEPEINLRPSN
jgi:hypothetical protein